MTYPADSIYQCSGGLYIQPTGTTASSVYGTLLAYTEDGYAFKSGVSHHEERVAEYAEVQGVVDTGDDPSILFAAKTFNINVAKAYVGNRASTVGTAANIVMDFPSTVIPGSSVVAYRFLFVPDDTTIPFAFVAHKGYMYTPDDSEIEFALGKDVLVPIIMRFARSSAGTASAVYNYRKVRIGRLDTLTVDTTLP